jgi:hypothetical protein
MPRAKTHAAVILREYHKAESELIGKAVVLTDGKAAHGLRLSVAGHPGKWPVSTIMLAQK